MYKRALGFAGLRGRVDARDIPVGAQKIASKKSSAVVYFSGVPDRLMAIGFVGKAVKPAFHYRFRSVEKRAEWVGKWMRGVDAQAERKAVRAVEEKAKRAAGHKLAVGDVLRSSWGYEQTNIDYYQVVELVGKCSVKIRAIAGGDVSQEGEDMHGDRGQCVPVPGVFLEGKEPMIKRVSSSGDGVRIASYAGAYKLEPMLVGGVKVWPRSYWSSYA